MDDQALLSQYVQHASSEAFAELVARHAGLVYSSALRQLGDSHLAEDATQAVFILLMHKSAKVRGPLAGWLMTVTWYVCRDMRKLQGRRSYHERQAAGMRNESEEAVKPPLWESYAPVLDGAIARLNRQERDAVVLRYFRNLSHKDVAETIGISENAARKRVDRGIENLRRIMSAKAVVPAAAVIAAHLQANASQAAPVSLVATISSGGAASSAASLIAQSAAKAMTFALPKLAAILLISIGIIAASLAAMTHGTGASPAPKPAPAMPPVAAKIVQESKIPGQIYIARWDMMLDDAAWQSVKKISTPVNTASKGIQSLRFNGAELRAAIDAANESKDVLGWTLMGVATPAETSIPNESGLWFDLQDAVLSLSGPVDRLVDKIVYAKGFSGGEGDRFNRTAPDHLHVTINHADMKLRVVEAFAPQMDELPVGTVSMNFDGDLAAGDAIAFADDMVGPSGRTNHFLLVWETFKAQPHQINCIERERDAIWWCHNGPDILRNWADAGFVWSAQSTRKAEDVAPHFERKLEDGKTIKLLAVSRRMTWPFCWWDAQGSPVVVSNSIEYLNGDPPAGITVMVALFGPASEFPLAKPAFMLKDAGSIAYRDQECFSLDENASKVEIGVLVGEWKEIGQLQPDQDITVDDVMYMIKHPRAVGDSAFDVEFDLSGKLGDGHRLVAVLDNGREFNQQRNPVETTLGGGREPGDESAKVLFTGSGVDKVKSFRVMRRKREYITFDGFAVNPTTRPSTSVSGDEVAALLKKRLKSGG